MTEPDFTNESVSEKNNLCQSMPKKSGPYSKKDKEMRRDEVYRLHFDYDFSARKIAELMNINRNTINMDLNYWYSDIAKSSDVINPEFMINITIQKLSIQYTRLREQLDKAESLQEKNVIERLMFDVNSKIININHRLAESTMKIMDSATNRLNDWLEKDGQKTRYLTLFDKIKVSSKAYDEISKIIDEDQKKGDYF